MAWSEDLMQLCFFKQKQPKEEGEESSGEERPSVFTYHGTETFVLAILYSYVLSKSPSY